MAQASIFQEKKEDHKFVLDKYEGPLDMLLSMIKDAKLDIKDIWVSSITDQYIEYIQSMQIIDLDKASDFVAMAATLLEIKSNDLLPKEEIEEDYEEEYVDEKAELERQLQLYAIFKEASITIKDRETTNRFFREPTYTEKDTKYLLKDTSLDDLLDAFAEIMHKIELESRNSETKSIENDVNTVAEKIQFVSETLKTMQEVEFFELFHKDFTRFSVLNTFLAILELLKRQFAEVTQEERYGNMIIKIKDGWENVSLEDFIENEES